jgi:alkyl sulfatase BDS1-like metallo-beta-lactamase superfamily hydrolase
MDCCADSERGGGIGGGDARFEIHKVADGVHAAVAAPAYKVNCNTAIIEGEDGVTIVDTHSKPSAARVIVEKLREITSKPVRFVVRGARQHRAHLHDGELSGTATDAAISLRDWE